jgi:hypothetical protein
MWCFYDPKHHFKNTYPAMVKPSSTTEKVQDSWPIWMQMASRMASHERDVWKPCRVMWQSRRTSHWTKRQQPCNAAIAFRRSLESLFCRGVEKEKTCRTKRRKGVNCSWSMQFVEKYQVFSSWCWFTPHFCCIPLLSLKETIPGGEQTLLIHDATNHGQS